MTEPDDMTIFTFGCVVCDHPFDIDPSSPPADDARMRCAGCGREMGTFAEAKRLLIEQAKAQVEADLRRRLGEKS